MRIVDVCAFYTPAGGGVRTYIEAKLRAAARHGHEMVVVAPGAHHETIQRAPGTFLVTVPSPELPVDRRYRYFDDERAIHQVLDAWQPDHVEASSPWSSATMVGRWQGAASRSLVMHCDPLAAYAYRWLGNIASRATIDRLFGWFWCHLRGLGHMFDAVICPNRQFADRLRSGGVRNVETNRLGVEADVFSPSLRCAELRSSILSSLGLDSRAILLIGVGRLSAEKRWDMVLRAVRESSKRNNIGFLLIGDGQRRRRLERLVGRCSNVALLSALQDRSQLARLMASADGLVHGCEVETFCLVAAEAHASGVPLITPDRGAAAGHVSSGAGVTYRAGDERSLEEAIEAFTRLRRDLQRSAAIRASTVRTMDEHFVELFERYGKLLPGPRPIWSAGTGRPVDAEQVPGLALASSTYCGRR